LHHIIIIIIITPTNDLCNVIKYSTQLLFADNINFLCYKFKCELLLPYTGCVQGW